MLTFPTLDALIVTALFLVPGYIWSAVHASLMPRRATETQVRIIEFLALSCLNHALWFWLFGLLFATNFSKNHPGWAGFLLIVPGIISPAALGLLTGRIYQGDLLRQTLGQYGFRTIRQIPTAWDYQFGKLLPHWVIVTLKDGSQVYGLYGLHSFAGDEMRERDLFLEATFTLRNDGEWLPVEGSAGILIKGDQITAISFRRYEDASHGDA